LGEDPIGFSSGDFNFYRYTWNSPTNFIDPYGHNAGTVAGAEIGFGLGGPIGAGIGAAIGTAAIWWGIPALWDWWNSPDDNVCYADSFPDTPTTNPDNYQKDGKKGKKNKNDGSYWEKDTSSHGGEQWKRWPNRKAKEKGRKPNSVWPDGRIRK